MYSGGGAVASNLCSSHCHGWFIVLSQSAPNLRVHLGVDLEMFSLCPANLPGFFMGDAPYLGNVVKENPCGLGYSLMLA